LERVTPDDGPPAAAWIALTDVLPVVVWTARADGRIEYVNRRWTHVTGIPTEQILGQGWMSVIHPLDAQTTVRAYAAALATGDPLRVELRVRHADGTYHWVRVEADPLRAGDGAIVRWLGVVLDVDGTYRAAQQFRALADAIPVIAWTADATGAIEWYNHRWYEYTGQTPDEALGWGWQATHHPDDFLEVMRRWPQSIETGEPFEMEFRLRRHDGAFEWFLTRGEPLRDADGRVVRWYGSNANIDAQRSALERTQRVAHTLQEVFLPKTLPQRPNLRIDAVYLASEKDALIGGDWFDAFEAPDGRLILSIGDVAGHGLEASIIVGRMRQAIFTLAYRLHDPAAILEELDRILRHQDPDTIVTALVGFIDPPHTSLTYASAGHPAPLLAYEDDVLARVLPGGGLPLGIGYDLGLQTHHIAVAADAVIALYTDGMIEFARDLLATETKLRSAVALMVGNTTIARPAVAVQELVFQDMPTRDDAALLLLQFSAVDRELGSQSLPVERTWRFHSSDAHTAHTSRQEIAEFIRSITIEPDQVFVAELIVGEMLANTVEHAPGLVEVHLDWSQERPTVTVRDTGPGCRVVMAGFPVDVLAEDGRGLFLIKTLAVDASVTALPGYGTEFRAVLPIKRTPLF
jgi:PAS domain S-box-containing protein